MNQIADTTPETFDADVLRAKVPVLVDFWAPWCAPCKVLGPQVERVAAENTGVLQVVKLNAEAHPDLALSHRVSGLPTLVVFVDGEEVARKVGAAGGYAAIRNLIAPHVSRSAT